MTKKKTLLIIPFVIVMSFILSLITPALCYADDSIYEPRLTAPSSSSAYYNRELNRYFQVGSGMPNCVAYGYGRIYEMNGEAPLITHGSAGDWYSSTNQTATTNTAVSQSSAQLPAGADMLQ